MRTPEEHRRVSDEDVLKLYRLIWMRFVASQMTPAVFDQTTIDVEAKGKDGARLFIPRHRQRAEKFDGFLKVYEEGKDAKDEDDAELKQKLPVVTAGRDAEVQVDRSGAALHRASAAIHRSDAGEGAGIGRRGTAFDLRVDSVDHSGARVRSQGRTASSRRRSWARW